MERSAQLDALFNPSSVAVIGASRDAAKAGGRFIKSLIHHRFKGQFYAVNPNETEVMGLKVYPSVQDIPGEIDLAIMTIPAQAAPEAMAECARKRVKFVILYSAGFREIGTEGLRLEARVVEAAREGGVRLIGPNCMGVYNPEAGLNTIVAHIEIPAESGQSAFVGQSGWASENFIVAGYDRGLRFSKVVSIGNQVDLAATDYLEYLGADPQTRVIGAYIEGIPNGREFLRRARETAARKPIIIWKAGRTGAGARAVASHTASLAGSYHVWDAAFKQAGIIRADHLDELIDFVAAFGCPYLPAGDRVGVIGEAGGGGAAACDACEGLGLHIYEFPEQVQQELKEFLRGAAAPFSSVRNPVDLVSPRRSEYPRVLPQCLELMASAVDALLFFTYHPLTEAAFLDIMEKLRDKIGKPIFVVPGYPTRESQGMAMYTRRGIPALPTPERAAKAISALRQYSRSLEERLGKGLSLGAVAE